MSRELISSGASFEEQIGYSRAGVDRYRTYSRCAHKPALSTCS